MLTLAVVLTVVGGLVAFVAGPLVLADWIHARRRETIARQIAVTDAIHGELGAVVAPVVTRRLGGPWEVIPNGVLVPDEAEPGGREHTITFAGRHEPRKGLQVLIRAWPEIRRHTGLRLRVVGADPLAVRLLLSRLRVPDEGIDVLGFLSQEELTDALRATKALVAPSLGGESFGMVLTRAFACATPVVASDIPGYREVVTPQTAVAVPPGDVDALADAVELLVADEPGRAAMGAAARELAVGRYAWADIARRLEMVYVRVVDGRQAVAA